MRLKGSYLGSALPKLTKRCRVSAISNFMGWCCCKRWTVGRYEIADMGIDERLEKAEREFLP
jgi:hypothetical protein